MIALAKIANWALLEEVLTKIALKFPPPRSLLFRQLKHPRLLTCRQHVEIR